MPLLDDASYRSAFGKKMQRVAASGDVPFPFWSYVDAIPQEDYQGYDCSDGSVQWVWRDENDRFEHILIDTKEDRDVFMVVVLDLQKKHVVGHRLMDFKREYGRR
jgi:hypothetical protein